LLHSTACFCPLQTRAKQGFAPLVIVVVGIIHSRHRNAKLSSTDLREEDAAERANLQHQQS
jgi:phosphopantetheine adenylyltransferase